MNKKTIYFDMDGTLVNLYGVENWLNKILTENFTPYEEAKPLEDMNELSNLLLKVQEAGNKLGIITWGSKYSSEKFLNKIKLVKQQWLRKYLPQVVFDEFVIMDYSCNKASSVKDPFGILFDDDKFVRKFWPGKAYSPEDMFLVLKKILIEGDDFERI